MWRLPGFSLSFLPHLSFPLRDMQVYLWQVFTEDLQAVIYALAVQCTVCLCYAPLCFSSLFFFPWDRRAPTVDELFIFVLEANYTHTHTHAHTHSWTQPANRRTNSVCWEEVRYNQFVKSTQAIIKPDRRLGAKAVHHSLFWPAWIADLM